MIVNIPKQIRKINRLREIATILAKYQVISISNGLSAINPITLISQLLGHEKEITKNEEFAVLIRKTFEELGTTYIKLGQWLSVRPDFAPPEILKELEKLQDRLPILPFKTIKRTIERETGKSIDQIFLKLSQQPISSASIAQVHFGTLKTGELVAVKVQRPNLKKLINVDIDILRTLVRLIIKKRPHLAIYNLDELLSAFKISLMKEINFHYEVGNQARMNMQYAKMPWIHIAKIYREFTTKQLIVMEYLEGVKLTQKEYFQNYKGDRNLLGQRFADCVFCSIFEYGFFQSDPHPGNVLIMKNSEFALIDFGITQTLDKETINILLHWYYASIYRDIDLFVESFLKIGTSLVPIDEIEFRNDCVAFIDEIHFQSSVERLSMAKLSEILYRIQFQHKIMLPPSFVLLFRTICIWDGSSRYVGVDLDWRKLWGPKLRKLIQSQLSPEAITKEFWRILLDYKSQIAKHPRDLRDVIKKIKEGKLKIEIQKSGIETQLRGIQKGLNKLAVSVFVSTIAFGLFYLGRGHGIQFLTQFTDFCTDFWWIVLLFILTILYLRKT